MVCAPAGSDVMENAAAAIAARHSLRFMFSSPL
jgi:hypothetical protein